MAVRTRKIHSEIEIEDQARILWDRDYRPGMVDNRDWDEVGGLMRFVYMGKAAEELLGFTDRQEYDDQRKRGY